MQIINIYICIVACDRKVWNTQINLKMAYIREKAQRARFFLFSSLVFRGAE